VTDANTSDLPKRFRPTPDGIPGHDHYVAITKNWQYSREAIAQLRDGLDGALPEGVKTIAIAGSFGRFEASSQSDADCIIVMEDGDEFDFEKTSVAANELIAERVRELRIAEPNPKGVFAKSRRFTELLPPEQTGEFGSHEEVPDVLGKRMLMLLESQPLCRDEAYDACLDKIFSRYAQYVLDDTSKEHLVLLNDLIRYFRFICINYQANFERENEKWPLRNLKLRHSRVVMYAGLLVLLGEASKYDDQRKLDWVSENLTLTPLERIAKVYGANNDSSFYRVGGLYNTFLDRLSDKTLREELNEIDYSARYANSTFATLKANSDALQAELTRFIYARRGDWSERFFEYLLF
jgi:predicted nucleotidyltransferase